MNAAKDATDLVARLRAFHYTAQSKEGKGELARVKGAGGRAGRAGQGGGPQLVGLRKCGRRAPPCAARLPSHLPHLSLACCPLLLRTSCFPKSGWLSRLPTWQNQGHTQRTSVPCLPNLSATLDPPPVRAQSGLDLVGGEIRDNIAAGVVEPALSKLKILQASLAASTPCPAHALPLPCCPAACPQGGRHHPPPPPSQPCVLPRGLASSSPVPPLFPLQFATEAAITILRIDDLIRLEPEPQEGEE